MMGQSPVTRDYPELGAEASPTVSRSCQIRCIQNKRSVRCARQKGQIAGLEFSVSRGGIVDESVFHSLVIFFLLIITVYGCASSSTPVTPAPPVANPGGPYTGNISQAINFNGAGSTAPSGQTITSYAWNFGDGSPAGTGASPTHAYASAGTFTVSLMVTDSTGGTNSLSTSATAYALPVANPGGPYAGNVGLAISFSGSGSTTAAGDAITTYSWNFGDGTLPVTGATPTHAYATPGPYTVSLMVTDMTGGTNTLSTTSTVYALPVANPGGPYTGNVGQAVSFSGSGSTTATGNAITTYVWNFGDGTPAGTGAAPMHTYTSAGTYTVSLMVTDTTGGTNLMSTSASIAGTGFVAVVSVNNSGVFSTFGGQNVGISATGRFVTFESQSTNLVSTMVSQTQVYMRDTCTGASSCTPSTSLMSINDTGTSGGGNTSATVSASVSGDGNYVVFTSQALDLISGALIHETYQRNTCATLPSCTPSTQYSIVDDFDAPLTYGGYSTVIDQSGRFVLASGTDQEIVGSQVMPGGSFNPEVIELYERDTCMTAAGPVSNCTPGNIGFTVTPGTTYEDSSGDVDTTYGMAVSNGGRFVAFSSGAHDLVSQDVSISTGVYTNQVYLRDTCSRLNNPIAGCTMTTVLVSQDNSGNAAKNFSAGPSVSDDGRFVLFTSAAPLATLATAGTNNVFLRDNCLAFTSTPVAGCVPSTTLISVNAAGTGQADGNTYYSQSLSADGRFAAFEFSTSGITADPSQSGGVYIRDTCNSSSGPIAGCTPHTVAVSFDAQGDFLGGDGWFALSADGHYITFVSASNYNGLVSQVILAATGF